MLKSAPNVVRLPTFLEISTIAAMAAHCDPHGESKILAGIFNNDVRLWPSEEQEKLLVFTFG